MTEDDGRPRAQDQRRPIGNGGLLASAHRQQNHGWNPPQESRNDQTPSQYAVRRKRGEEPEKPRQLDVAESESFSPGGQEHVKEKPEVNASADEASNERWPRVLESRTH